MLPEILAFDQSLWKLAQDVLKGPLYLAKGRRRCTDPAPVVQVGWTGEDNIDNLNQEPDAMWL